MQLNTKALQFTEADSMYKSIPTDFGRKYIRITNQTRC